MVEFLALSGKALPLLRAWVGDEPDCGVGRGLLTLATGDRLTDTVLKEQLAIAHRDARAAGERETSLVYGVFLHTHRQYRLTADHLVAHSRCRENSPCPAAPSRARPEGGGAPMSPAGPAKRRSSSTSLHQRHTILTSARKRNTGA
ncbi:hypothetical protein [Streptomyces sp. NPDC001091]